MSMIVYCRCLDDCADLYLFFRNYLGRCFTERPGAPNLPRFRLVEMYMSFTDAVVKENMISSFGKEPSLHIVIATVAFGMGFDCLDVRQVISLG